MGWRYYRYVKEAQNCQKNQFVSSLWKLKNGITFERYKIDKMPTSTKKNYRNESNSADTSGLGRPLAAEISIMAH